MYLYICAFSDRCRDGLPWFNWIVNSWSKYRVWIPQNVFTSKLLAYKKQYFLCIEIIASGVNDDRWVNEYSLEYTAKGFCVTTISFCVSMTSGLSEPISTAVGGGNEINHVSRRWSCGAKRRHVSHFAQTYSLFAPPLFCPSYSTSPAICKSPTFPLLSRFNTFVLHVYDGAFHQLLD